MKKHLAFIFQISRMPTKASKTARNHSESRGCVCAVCFQKTADIRVISSEIESLIQSFANEDYSIKNEGLPNSICSKCRLKLVAMGKVLFSVLKRNFSNFSAEPREVKHTSKNRLQSTYPSTSLYQEPNWTVLLVYSVCPCKDKISIPE